MKHVTMFAFDCMLSNPSKFATIYNIAGIRGKLYSPNAISKKSLM
jgi:hypothetical protein